MPQTTNTVPSTPQSIRFLSVAMTVAQLRELRSEKRITLILPAGNATGALTVVAHLAVNQRVRDEQFVWRGTIEGDPQSAVTLSYSENALVGDIQTSRGKLYRARIVKPADKHRVVGIIEELNSAAFPREERAAQLHPNPAPIPGTVFRPTLPPTVEKLDRLPAASNTTADAVISVMVLYTSAATTFEGSAPAMDLTINGIVSDTNAAYRDSEIHQQIKLVPDHAIATQYQEQSDISADRQALMNHEGALDNVPGLRRDNQADIVVLITQPAGATDSCGAAQTMLSAMQSFCSQAFAVVPVNCATASQYSFAHELGHLMGADHDDLSGPTAAPPSRGYVHEAPSKGWYTIMAYPAGKCAAADCRRILQFSNPAISYPSPVPGGSNDETPSAPTGTAQANNAATLNSTAATVATFHSSPSCN